MKILLVEDDARTADFILKGLQQSGYSTVHAATGPDGLFKAETEECDLAIIDIMLPGMDGFTLIEKLRADRSTMPVIVLSAKNSVADKIRGLQNGGDDYLVKPFSFSELVARILLTALPWYLAGLTLYLLTAWICLEPTWKRRLANLLIAVGVCRIFFLSDTPQAYDGMLPWLALLLVCSLFFPLLSVYRFKQGCQD